MPKETFENLSEAKREIILQACFEEFSNNSYDTASISKIVKKLTISKGSIYQYFNDKKDLYLFLIETACKFKMIYIIKNINFREQDFYDSVKKLINVSLKFDIEYKEYGSLLSRICSGNNDAFGAETQILIKNLSEGYFLQLIMQAQQRGEVSKEFEPELIVYIIYQITINSNIIYNKNDSKEFINKFLKILKYGLRGRED